jgi:hypothetical protein
MVVDKIHIGIEQFAGWHRWRRQECQASHDRADPSD